MTVAAAIDALLATPIAHRGLHGVGGALENTIASAQAAVAAGFGIECDVRLSADNQIVVFHDATLARLAGRAVAVATTSAAVLTAIPLQGGATIPLLADWLNAIAGRVPVVIEIKTEPSTPVPTLVAALAAALDGRVAPIALESFDPAVVAACAAIQRPVGLVGETVQQLDTLERLPRCDFASWHLIEIERLAARFPDLPRTAWTVRSPADHARAARAGAQSVFEGFLP